MGNMMVFRAGFPRKGNKVHAGMAPRACPICLDRVSEIVTRCDHAYCRPCLSEWMLREKTTCPACRRSITEHTCRVIKTSEAYDLL